MSNRPRSCRRLSVLLGIVLAALLWLPLLAVVSADFSFKEWRYSKPVTLPSLSGGEELVEVDLDRDVFQGAARAQVDLRLVEAGGREVAYQLVVEQGGTREESLQGKVRDLGHVPGQHSSFVVDLGRNGALHNRVKILTGSKNFQRKVTVEGSPDAQSWAVLREGVEIFDFTVEERHFNYLRATIHNEDNPLLSIDGIEAEGLARRVLFLAQPGETYSLYYGNPGAGPVSYDLANLLPYLDAESPLTGSLGAQTDNPQFTVPKPPFSERFPWLITVGVAAAAAVMALLLFGFLKQAKKSLPPPGASDGLEESRSE